MIKTLIRAMYSAFISIVLISIILAGWTCFAFISHSTKSGEIINMIQNMYESQKSVFIDVIDLSKLLIKDTSERIATENNNLSESEFLTDQEDKPLVNESSILEDNGENPLGIVVEPSLPQVREEDFPGITVGPLDSDQGDVPMDEMELGMDMN